VAKFGKPEGLMLVMKFGGTSVECAESIMRVCKIVRGRLHLRPAVVVSALAGVTDQLHTMGLLSRDGKREQALQQLAAVEARHFAVAVKLLSAGNDLVESTLQPSFEEARALLRAIAALGELTPRTLDRLLSFGERWSSSLLIEAFRVEGLPAVLVDACEVVITNSNHSHAAPLMDEIATRAQSKIRRLVEDGHIPVLGGFIGATRDGLPTTLGRGGSDFTASIIGASLAAERIEIWTDVDGMLTADPRICPDAQNIESISFEEAAELAHFGAKVLHPKTLQPAVERGIPVYVLNSRQPQNSGTRVESEASGHAARVRSIACKRGIILTEVAAKPGLEANFAASVFATVEAQKCLVDLAAMSRSNVSLLLSSRDSAAGLAAALDGAATVKVTPGVALVSLVGRSVARDPAISADALATLPHQAVKMIFHGASDMNLSFVVDEQSADDVVRRLHAALFPLPSGEAKASRALEFFPARNGQLENLVTAGEA
jgi:aspartate kinase